ncbi:MAG: hypothetical protein AAGG68_24520 [Bacteroidota bacterium]
MGKNSEYITGKSSLNSAGREARKEAMESLHKNALELTMNEREREVWDSMTADEQSFFLDTGKLPGYAQGRKYNEQYEFSHLFSKNSYPEISDEPGSGIFRTRIDHRLGDHGGDTSAPLHGSPRDPDWRDTWGTQEVDSSSNKHWREYLGMSTGESYEKKLNRELEREFPELYQDRNLDHSRNTKESKTTDSNLEIRGKTSTDTREIRRNIERFDKFPGGVIINAASKLSFGEQSTVDIKWSDDNCTVEINDGEAHYLTNLSSEEVAICCWSVWYGDGYERLGAVSQTETVGVVAKTEVGKHLLIADGIFGEIVYGHGCHGHLGKSNISGYENPFLKCIDSILKWDEAAINRYFDSFCSGTGQQVYLDYNSVEFSGEDDMKGRLIPTINFTAAFGERIDDKTVAEDGDLATKKFSEEWHALQHFVENYSLYEERYPSYAKAREYATLIALFRGLKANKCQLQNSEELIRRYESVSEKKLPWASYAISQEELESVCAHTCQSIYKKLKEDNQLTEISKFQLWALSLTYAQRTNDPNIFYYHKQNALEALDNVKNEHLPKKKYQIERYILSMIHSHLPYACFSFASLLDDKEEKEYFQNKALRIIKDGLVKAPKSEVPYLVLSLANSTYSDLDKFEEVLERCNLAYELFDAHNKPYFTAQCANLLGLVWSNKSRKLDGDEQKKCWLNARNHYNKAIELLIDYQRIINEEDQQVSVSLGYYYLNKSFTYFENEKETHKAESLELASRAFRKGKKYQLATQYAEWAGNVWLNQGRTGKNETQQLYYTKAKNCYDDAIRDNEQWFSIKEPNILCKTGELHTKKARIYEDLGKWDEAALSFKLASDVFIKANQYEQAANKMHLSGNAWIQGADLKSNNDQQEYYNNAIGSYNDAIDLLNKRIEQEKSDDKLQKRLGFLFQSLASTYEKISFWLKAAESYKTASDTFFDINECEYAVINMNFSGDMWFKKAELENKDEKIKYLFTAKKCHEQAIQQILSVVDLDDDSDIINIEERKRNYLLVSTQNLANDLRHLGEWTEAAAYYLTLSSFYETIKKYDNAARYAIEAGNMWIKQSKVEDDKEKRELYNHAKDCYHKAIRQYKYHRQIYSSDKKILCDFGVAYLSKANIHQELGEFQLAISNYTDAKILFEQAEDIRAAECANLKGINHVQLANTNVSPHSKTKRRQLLLTAKKCYEEAIELCKLHLKSSASDNVKKEFALYHLNLGDVCQGLRLWDLASYNIHKSWYIYHSANDSESKKKCDEKLKLLRLDMKSDKRSSYSEYRSRLQAMSHSLTEIILYNFCDPISKQMSTNLGMGLSLQLIDEIHIVIFKSKWKPLKDIQNIIDSHPKVKKTINNLFPKLLRFIYLKRDICLRKLTIKIDWDEYNKQVEKYNLIMLTNNSDWLEKQFGLSDNYKCIHPFLKFKRYNECDSFFYVNFCNKDHAFSHLLRSGIWTEGRLPEKTNGSKWESGKKYSRIYSSKELPELKIIAEVVQ